MNKVFLIGNTTKDITLETTNNGIGFAKFNIAVPRGYKNSNNEREVDFIPIIAWRNIAENCSKYANKGSKIAVFGRIQTRSYDVQDGSKRYVTEIIADEVEFLSYKNNEKQNIETQDNQIKLEPISNDDSLPF